VNLAKIEQEDVIEIGPGLGALTKELLKVTYNLIAIEKDRDLIPILEKKFEGCTNFKLYCRDFLEIDLDKFVQQNCMDEVSICANLPYYVTTPIMIKILQAKKAFKKIVLMVQKEVALRIVAKPGEKGCGAISVFIHYFTSAKILFHVSRGSFFPVPKVDSSVILLERKDIKEYLVEDEEKFFEFVRICFSQKRKFLINPVSKKFNISKKDLNCLLTDLKINVKARAQDLKLKDFVFLFKRVEKMTQQSP
jgi:16S rRNA (adenine1518-N6/adenine1519-N6)-dimethyltransferase